MRRFRGVREIGWFFSRAKRGWATCDWWNLDGYLARLLSGALREFAAKGMSHPPDLSPEEWERRLLKMAEGFAAYLRGRKSRR